MNHWVGMDSFTVLWTVELSGPFLLLNDFHSNNIPNIIHVTSSIMTPQISTLTKYLFTLSTGTIRLPWIVSTWVDMFWYGYMQQELSDAWLLWNDFHRTNSHILIHVACQMPIYCGMISTIKTDLIVLINAFNKILEYIAHIDNLERLNMSSEISLFTNTYLQ